MADIFLSYASEDRERAATLAQLLEARAWSVWWDRRIFIGEAFDKAIERELETAKAVVVLWSTHSIESEWVKNEAAVASERGVLVPAMIDPVKLPLEFRRKQTADLSDWRGGQGHPGLIALFEGAAAAISGRPVNKATSNHVLPRSSPSFKRWVVAVVVLAVGGTGAVISQLDRFSAESPGETAAAATRYEHADDPPPNSTSPEVPRDSATTIVPQPAGLPSLADQVVGRYYGDVIADSTGPSRSDVSVTVTKLERLKVRVTSDYAKIGSHDIELTRVGDSVTNLAGETLFTVDTSKRPHTIGLNPRMALAYTGVKQD
jgi:hypothetical protein